MESRFDGSLRNLELFGDSGTVSSRPKRSASRACSWGVPPDGRTEIGAVAGRVATPIHRLSSTSTPRSPDRCRSSSRHTLTKIRVNQTSTAWSSRSDRRLRHAISAASCTASSGRRIVQDERGQPECVVDAAQQHPANGIVRRRRRCGVVEHAPPLGSGLSLKGRHRVANRSILRRDRRRGSRTLRPTEPSVPPSAEPSRAQVGRVRVTAVRLSSPSQRVPQQEGSSTVWTDELCRRRL